MSEPLYINEVFSSIQGEGMLAGRRQIFVRMAKCNLDCRYCDTNFSKSDMCQLESKPGSGVFEAVPQPISLKRIIVIIKDWQSQLPGAHHSISFTGGEPLLDAEFLIDWLPEIRKLIPVHLETNGTMASALKSIIGHIDFVSMDMKLPSTAGYVGDLWESHHLFLKESLCSNVSVKIVVGESTDSSEINKVCDIIEGVERTIPLFLQPLTLQDGCIGISALHLMRLHALASSRLPEVLVIPQMHKLLGVL